jgi:endonuclease/exonuclease/phosphatase family metal-dependent hydrolase
MNSEAAKLSRRHWLRAILSAGAAVLTSAGGSAQQASVKRTRSVHRILTCNILFDLPEQHGTPEDWNLYRRDACMQIIRSRNPDIICLQEVGRGQNQDFIEAFPEFEAFGYPDPYVDTIPKRFQNIKNVILFSRERYDQTTGGTYWLSDKPLIAGSRLPGTKLPRHVTWLRLVDKPTGREFRVATTHLALEQPVRVQEAIMIAEESAQYSRCFPQILTGDMNAQHTSQELTVLTQAGWIDTYEAMNGTQPIISTPGRDRKIDFIFTRGDVLPTAAEIIRDALNGHQPSDHYFVSADVELADV